MILDILWLLVPHWGLTEMAIGALLCSTQHASLSMERFFCVSVPFPAPVLWHGYFVWKEDFIVSSLKDLEKG